MLYGSTQACLTVRHVDGFALWPTRSNNYSVASSPWRGGKGDVVGELAFRPAVMVGWLLSRATPAPPSAADFVASMRRLNVSVCFYIILGFNDWANSTGVPPAAYLAQQVTVLTELLTQYGPVDRLWWDEYAGHNPGQFHEGFSCPDGHPDPVGCPAWTTLIDLVRELSPSTAIVPGPDGCLVNSESPGGTYPLYHATFVPMSGYACNGNAVGAYDGGATFTVVESDYSMLNPGDWWFWNPAAPFLNASAIAAQVRGGCAGLVLRRLTLPSHRSAGAGAAGVRAAPARTASPSPPTRRWTPSSARARP